MIQTETSNCIVCNTGKNIEFDNEIVTLNISLLICKNCIKIMQSKNNNPLVLINMIKNIDLSKCFFTTQGI